MVRSAGLEPALYTSSTCSLCRWSTSAWSRQPVPTRTAGLTKARSRPRVTACAAGEGLEPPLRGSGPRGLPISRPGIECGRRDSNAHATRSELARYTGSRHSRIVRRQGLEPRTQQGSTRQRHCPTPPESAGRSAAMIVGANHLALLDVNIQVLGLA